MRKLNLQIVVLALVTLIASSARAAEPAPQSIVSTAPATQPSGGGPAVVISLTGEIDNYNRDVLFRNFARARKLGAKTIMLKIDTYGGLVTSGLDISRFIKNQTDLHTVAFVDNKAISAGAMIALACNEIVMMPSGTLGDCAPIQFTPDGKLDSLGDTERQKAESPVLADFRESARRNGYNELVATSMVSLPVTVYYVQDGEGHRKFVDQKGYDAINGDGWTPVPGVESPVDGPQTLLTVSTDTALKLGLAKAQVSSAEALASQRGETILADLTPSFGDGLISLLQNAAVRGLLLTIFMMSLYIAINAPGHGAAEAIALVSLALLVGVPLLTGYGQWWEVGLIFAGIALIAFEVFVFPGHLVSAVLGALMVLVGFVLTFIGDVTTMPNVWQMPATWAALQKGVWTVAGAMFCSMLLSAWLRRFLPRIPIFNRLILTATTGNSPATTVPIPSRSAVDAADVWPFIGTVGRATSDLRPGGSAEFPFAADTRPTAVISEGSYISAGAKVIVREVHGNRVVVRAVV